MEKLFWLISKIFWSVAAPDVFVFIVLLIGTFLLFTKARILGSALVATVTIFILVLNIFPVHDMILSTLEERFPFHSIPDKLDGVIVLGGAIEPEKSTVWKQPMVSDSAERLFAFIYLNRKFPRAKFVFSGGAGSLNSTYKHSDGARVLFKQAGLDVDEILFESQSKNTYENIINSFNLVKPNKNEKWLVITSAFHMPRVMGIFRKIKWEVIPYPVDYRTLGHQKFQRDFKGFYVLHNLTFSVKEWIGLFVYWIMGKTSSFFPMPLS